MLVAARAVGRRDPGNTHGRPSFWRSQRGDGHPYRKHRIHRADAESVRVGPKM